MRGKYRPHHILEVVLLFIALPGFFASNSKANENSKYLDAVREFADNVLKYGRDTYGPKHTPLFVDGLNIHTHEPVKWIAPSGEKWVLSNLASQQNLFRSLDGLTKITDDPKYRQAAVEAIEYAFANLRSPNGLLYWGVGIAYDAQAEKQCGIEIHSLKCHCPYYELMWEVDPRATRKFIEAYWSAHILDWSNLDMNRGAPLNKPLGETWSHEYKGGPVFFESSGSSMLVAGTDLFWAAGFLGKASGNREPLVWAKRLIHRYVETRNPGVGLSGAKYTHGKYDGAKHQLGDMLDADGREFNRWALEELTSLGKIAYRKNDNSFIPMLTDGTSLEGYVCKKDGAYGNKGTVFEPIKAVPMDFWTYALAYRLTSDQFMWDMARSIAYGHGLGDIGVTPETHHQLKTTTDCWQPYTLLGFLELYKKTENQAFLKIARKIGDNLLARRFHKGFFVPSDKHIYAKFDTIEHLVLLQLHAALRQTFSCVPEVWPGKSLFNSPYRDRKYASDYSVIYALTESPYPPKSLEEAVVSGDVEEVRLLISQGADVNARSEGSYRTPLHWAAMEGHRDIVELLLAHDAGVNTGRITALHYAAKKGHKEIAELLIAKGADVNAKEVNGDTPLHYAGKAGHKDIVELFIAKGAKINAKNIEGRTPLDIAVANNRKDIIELFLAKGADTSIHVAAQVGDLARVGKFVEGGANVNAKNNRGMTALHLAIQKKHQDVAKFLITKGADVNAKDKSGYTPLYYALWKNNKDVVKLLVDKGADVNVLPDDDGTPLEYAVWNVDVEMAKLFVARGAKFDLKDNDGWTAFRYAASQGNRELVEFFVAKGADVSSFHMAACMGDLARVKDFVQQGTDIDTKDEMDWTALYWAASIGQEDVAEFLIAEGADVGARTKSSSTPLHQAAQSGELNLVQLFISKGTDVNAKDKDGKTPLSLAVEEGHTEIVELLRKYGDNE